MVLALGMARPEVPRVLRPELLSGSALAASGSAVAELGAAVPVAAERLAAQLAVRLE